MREVVTPKGSRFLLCQLNSSELKLNKYPPQPVIQCRWFENRFDDLTSSMHRQ